MDQRAYAVEEDLKHILHTRSALEDKLQLLERRVEETVQGTKAAAIQALDLARDKTVDLIEAAVHQLSPTEQAGRRPWLLMGAAVAAGFLTGWMNRRRPRVVSYGPRGAHVADVMPSDERDEPERDRGVYPFYPSGPEGRDHADVRRQDQEREFLEEDSPADLSRGHGSFGSMLSQFKEEAAQEGARLRGAALHAGRSFIQDLIRIAGRTLIDQLERHRRETGGKGETSEIR